MFKQLQRQITKYADGLLLSLNACAHAEEWILLNAEHTWVDRKGRSQAQEKGIPVSSASHCLDELQKPGNFVQSMPSRAARLLITGN